MAPLAKCHAQTAGHCTPACRTKCAGISGRLRERNIKLHKNLQDAYPWASGHEWIAAVIQGASMQMRQTLGKDMCRMCAVMARVQTSSRPPPAHGSMWETLSKILGTKLDIFPSWWGCLLQACSIYYYICSGLHVLIRWQLCANLGILVFANWRNRRVGISLWQ